MNHRITNGGILQGCKHTTILLNHEERNRVINSASNFLCGVSFDSIVVCGTSGLLVGPQVSEKLNKNITMVRKKNEKRYSPFIIEGAYPNQYVILDDLVCSGSTLKHILHNIKEEYPTSKCVGVYMYLREECGYAGSPEVFSRQFGVKYLNPWK